MSVQIVKLLGAPVEINIPLNPRGVYNGATAYATGDSVSYNGTSYIALTATTGNLPTDTSKWQVLAAKGDTGAASTVPGPAGVVASIVAGANVTVDASDPANPIVSASGGGGGGGGGASGARTLIDSGTWSNVTSASLGGAWSLATDGKWAFNFTFAPVSARNMKLYFNNSDASNSYDWRIHSFNAGTMSYVDGYVGGSYNQNYILSNSTSDLFMGELFMTTANGQTHIGGNIYTVGTSMENSLLVCNAFLSDIDSIQIRTKFGDTNFSGSWSLEKMS